MKIVELSEDGGSDDDCGGREIVPIKAKKALVGAGARILFYPTLLYNVFRSKIQAEFRWWDEVDQVIVPFSSLILCGQAFVKGLSAHFLI